MLFSLDEHRAIPGKEFPHDRDMHNEREFSVIPRRHSQDTKMRTATNLLHDRADIGGEETDERSVFTRLFDDFIVNAMAQIRA